MRPFLRFLIFAVLTTPSGPSISSGAEAEEPQQQRPALLGSWVNTDPETRWYGKIDFVDEDGKIFMELWGIQGGKLSTEPVAKIELPIDAKTLRIPPLVGVSEAKDYGFMVEEFTLKRKSDELQLTGESFFRDGSNRNRKVTERFAKAES